MAIDMDLAKRLKVYRNFKHLTQKEVASHLNVPHSAISDIENGKRDVTVSELKILSHLYGRSVEEIMSGKKYDYPDYKSHLFDNDEIQLGYHCYHEYQ